MRTQLSHADDEAAPHAASTAELGLIVEQAAGLRLVVADGELDVANAARLDDALTAIAPPVDLLVDLCRVEFVDCVAAHRLERAASAQAAAGRRFAIACSADGAVARLFEVLAAAGLELPVHHSRAEALRSALATPAPTLQSQTTGT
jgi:anti-anti-sigma factor